MKRRPIVVLIVSCATLVFATPAHAQPAARAASDDDLRARAAICIPCGVAAVALVTRAASAIRAAPAIQKLAVVGRAMRPSSGGVRITGERLFALRAQAQLVAQRGTSWVQANWPRLRPFVRACLAGVAALETTTILSDGRMTLKEWKHYLLFADLGSPNTDILDLYFNPALDFGVPKDSWYAACAAGIVAKGVAG